MASYFYPEGLEVMFEEGYQFDSANVKAALINSVTAYNVAHDFWNDVSAGEIDASKALTTPAWDVAAGVLVYDSDDTGANMTWAAVAGGSTIGAVVVYYDTGNAATSPLISFNDVTDTATNGGDIVITWHANGIGRIDCT